MQHRQESNSTVSKRAQQKERAAELSFRELTGLASNTIHTQAAVRAARSTCERAANSTMREREQQTGRGQENKHVRAFLVVPSACCCCSLLSSFSCCCCYCCFSNAAAEGTGVLFSFFCSLFVRVHVCVRRMRRTFLRQLKL